MLTNPKHDEIIVEDFHIKRQKAGLRRDFMQIRDTISFELRRNLNRFIIMLLMYLSFFILGIVILESSENLGIPIPTDSTEYIKGYLDSQFGFLLIISGAAFGGSIIAEDFSKQTSNLLFPKTTKANLLIGRIISRYFLMAVCLMIYYFLICSTTLIKYEGIPLTILSSFGWALFCSFTILIFFTMLSSFMKNTSMAIIAGILITLIIFEMVSMILSMSGIIDNNELPMLFILTYYMRIIPESLSMPQQRYSIIRFQMIEGEPIEITTWLTPSEIGAFFGLIIYISILLFFTLLRYKRRQSKGE
ncbi:MAG: ABC transporter permease [Promethearchaeota archaeon]